MITTIPRNAANPPAVRELVITGGLLFGCANAALADLRCCDSENAVQSKNRKVDMPINIGIRTSLTKHSRAGATSRAGGPLCLRATIMLRATVLALIVALLMTPAVPQVAMAQSSTAPVEQSSAPTAAPPTPVTTPDSATLNNSATKPAELQPSGQTIGGALLPHDLSPWGMFLNADIVVKAVIIGLAFASLVTWTAFVAKSLELRSARGHVRRALRILSGSTTLVQVAEQLGNGTHAASQLMQAAAQEIRLSANLHGDGLKERIALLLERIELANSRKISRGTGVLATIGSTAPFVGLFGTVWGIMNSFIGISNAHTTNLAVVAPGIAEALLATALGLVAAIPAVVIYNVLVRSTAHYRALLGDASAQVMRLVSRDLDRSKLRLGLAAE
jgi:biopolymer transport protein ExbB